MFIDLEALHAFHMHKAVSLKEARQNEERNYPH